MRVDLRLQSAQFGAAQSGFVLFYLLHKLFDFFGHMPEGVGKLRNFTHGNIAAAEAEIRRVLFKIAHRAHKPPHGRVYKL